MTVKPGDRVQITGLMPDDPDPIPIGSTGTVVRVNSAGQADVDWDVANPKTGVKRQLMLLLDVDPYQVIGQAASPEPTCKGYGPLPTDNGENHMRGMPSQRRLPGAF